MRTDKGTVADTDDVLIEGDRVWIRSNGPDHVVVVLED